MIHHSGNWLINAFLVMSGALVASAAICGVLWNFISTTYLFFVFAGLCFIFSGFFWNYVDGLVKQ